MDISYRISFVFLWTVWCLKENIVTGSSIPPLDSALVGLDPKSVVPPSNCTAKRCRMIHKLNYDGYKRIAIIRQKVLEKIHAGLKSSQDDVSTTASTTAPEPVTSSTVQPIIATRKPPPSMFEMVVTFAEDPDLPNATVNNIVQFKVLGQVSGDKPEVKKADLWVMVRLKNKSKKKKHRMRSLRRRRGRHVRLKISTIKTSNSRQSRDLKGDKQEEVLSEVSLRVKKTQWQKFGMPLKLIQQMVDNPSQTLSLRVDCKGCGRKVQPILLYRSKDRKRSARTGRKKRRKRKLSKKRPLLVIHLMSNTQTDQ